MARPRILGIGAFVAWGLAGTHAVAGEGQLSEARAAYDRGAQAYNNRDYQTAAVQFARADELAPNEVVLESALFAAERADAAVLAMNLVERARWRGWTLAPLDRIIARFAPRIASAKPVCATGIQCSISIDGENAVEGRTVWLPPARHAIEFRTTAGVERRTFELAPGNAIVLTADASADEPPAAPPPESKPDEPKVRSGPSPAWFWGGTGITVALGVVTAISTADTLQQHDEFTAHRTRTGADNGLDAQTRTNVLLVSTLACAAITAAIGIFVVDWRKPSSPKASSVSHHLVRF